MKEFEVYIVLSRDNGDFIYCTTDKVKAYNKMKEQTLNEEMQGGRPSVYILTTDLIK